MQKSKTGAEIIEAYRDQSELSLEEMIDAELSKVSIVIPTHERTIPSQLPTGFYWLFEENNEPVIVEKRQGAEYVQFTNGRREFNGNSALTYIGPLTPPANT